MRIAIGSGKGGTGKTTLTVALAQAAIESVQVLDCDVEEPNAHLFLRPELKESQSVTLLTPEVNAAACTGCGECSRMCQFNAIVALSSQAMVFPELCHGCGGCTMVCPHEAIKEVSYPIGTLEKGKAGDIEFAQGTLTVGRAMSPPVIRAVKNQAIQDGLVLLDCPPGTACPFMAAVKGVDAVILVTEPTAFGLHDLGLAVDTIVELGLPMGVVVNRVHEEENNITAFCHERDIPVLLQIPEQRSIAEAYSQGKSLIDADPSLRKSLQGVLETVTSWITKGGQR